MKLEDQVVSLELSKRVAELGVKRESLWNWLVASDGARIMRNPVRGTYKYFDQYPAYTAAELGEILPDNVVYAKTEGSAKTWGKWVCSLEDEDREDGYFLGYSEYGDTEANARAKMLIYLLENELLKI